jgi:membrane fusion protein (multidrug efflux system)
MILLWVSSRLKSDEKAPPRPVPVVTIRPSEADLGHRVVVPAILETEKTVTVVPRVGGRLLEVYVEEGDRISKGDVLAEVDPEPYELDFRAAESAWLLSESGLSRIRSLHDGAGASLQRLDEAQTSRDAAYASYKLAQMKLDYAEIRAPMSGMVLRRFADPGNSASTEVPLFTIVDEKELRIAAQVPEKYWDQFASTDNINVHVARPDSDILDAREARIIRVSPVIDPLGGTFEVICSPSFDGASWPLGTHLTVEFTLDPRKNSRSLPLNALDGDEFVWLVRPGEGTVRRLDASNLYRDGYRLALPESWPDGDYVLEGHHRLHDGQQVISYGTDT